MWTSHKRRAGCEIKLTEKLNNKSKSPMTYFEAISENKMSLSHLNWLPLCSTGLRRSVTLAQASQSHKQTSLATTAARGRLTVECKPAECQPLTGPPPPPAPSSGRTVCRSGSVRDVPCRAVPCRAEPCLIWDGQQRRPRRRGSAGRECRSTGRRSWPAPLHWSVGPTSGPTVRRRRSRRRSMRESNGGGGGYGDGTMRGTAELSPPPELQARFS